MFAIQPNKKMQGMNTLTNLTNLELYDNNIAKLEGIENLVGLTNLDLSYNKIRQLQNLSSLTNLKTLYCANNKLKTIGDGLSCLTSLTRLDLGSNKLRKFEGLGSLTNLEELWMGRNKITQISGIENLTSLRILDVQSNRLLNLTYGPEDPKVKNGDMKASGEDANSTEHSETTETKAESNDAVATDSGNNADGKDRIDSLTNNVNLEELYLGHNNITEIKGIEALTRLNTLDFSSNKIKRIQNVEQLSLLEEFWMSGNLIDSYDEIKNLSNCKVIKTVYLEHNPISKDFEYRMRTAEMLPSLKQIDATPCRR